MAKALTLLLAPAIYLAFVWAFALNSSSFLKAIPPIVFSGQTDTVFTALPAVPNSLIDAFKIGELEGQIQLITSHNLDSPTVDQILLNAKEILGRPITVDQLHGIRKILQEISEERSITQRIIGVFSFINFIWFISIAGILATIGPVLFFCAKPIVEVLVKVFTDIIVPILIALKPLYEYIFYAISFLFIVEGTRFPAETGFFVSLTGALAAIPCFFYSTYLHSSGGGDKNLFAQVINIFVALVWIPLAVLYQSSILGFFAVLGIYGALGFSVVCTGLCYYIGFDSRDSLNRVVATSTFFIIFLTTAKITRWNPYFIGPFAIGGTTMGNVTYFLGLLIVSSRYYSYYRPKNQYMVIQAIMIVSLLVALFFGNVFGITSMVNVASTFAVLFVMEKVLEIPRIFEGPMLFVTLLGLSICLYMASFFLSTHPGWIVNMFSD